MAEQVPYQPDASPFGNISFAENPEPRCPCVLLLDISGSMQGAPIAQLNAGLTVYHDELAADSLAAKRVEVAIVTFGGQVQTACEFVTAEHFGRVLKRVGKFERVLRSLRSSLLA
jgi:hypothetical protein